MGYRGTAHVLFWDIPASASLSRTFFDLPFDDSFSSLTPAYTLADTEQEFRSNFELLGSATQGLRGIRGAETGVRRIGGATAGSMA
jgi:hypothetical protein